MKTRVTSIVVALTLCTTMAHAQNSKTVKIGVLNDQSGLYADMGGLGSVVAAKLAVEDSGLAKKGWNIEVIGADHQNKSDVAVGIARRWFDLDGVDVVTDATNSAVALALNSLVREKKQGGTGVWRGDIASYGFGMLTQYHPLDT